MDTLIGLSPIIFYIVLAVVIFVIIRSVLKNARPNGDLERRIRDLEEENRNIKNKLGM